MKHETVTKESFKQGGWKAQYPKYRNISTPESRFYKHAAVLIPPNSSDKLQMENYRKKEEKRKEKKLQKGKVHTGNSFGTPPVFRGD